jgi:ubiquinone/menaquinone biosynthesis C-methylase UbiE
MRFEKRRKIYTFSLGRKKYAEKFIPRFYFLSKKSFFSFCFSVLFSRFFTGKKIHLLLKKNIPNTISPREIIQTFASSVEAAKQLVEQNPQHIFLWENLVNVLLKHHQTANAMNVLFQSLLFHCNAETLTRTLARLLHEYQLPPLKYEFIPVLRSLCENNNVGNREISFAIVTTIKQLPEFSVILRSAEQHLPAVFSEEHFQRFFKNDLCIAAVPRIVFRDEECERVFTYIRRNILFQNAEHHVSDEKLSVPFSFVCALARQNFYNEYVCDVHAEERVKVNALFNKLEMVLHDGTEEIHLQENEFAIVALYKPLSSFENAHRFWERDLTRWSAPFRNVIQEQIINGRREKECEKKIFALAEVENETSQAVQQQYEENPYPRWISISKPEPISFQQWLKKFFPREKNIVIAKPATILIAGCGTGAHPIKTSMRFPDSEITAVDFSKASLMYAQRKTEEYDVRNITYVHGDILSLSQRSQKFFLIECSGVLHHLRSPLAGWNILTELLEKNGVMKIGLYSEAARRDVREARTMLEAKNFLPTENGIREARQYLFSLPNEHPAKAIILSSDFYTLSSCRDLLFHVEEHTFTIPKLVEAMRALHLRFLGFELDAKLRAGFTTMFPEKDALADLYKWKLFETKNPKAFSAMYKFWCCKK